jgi:hypothetical protein
MAEKTGLEVLCPEWLLEKRILAEVYHAQTEVETGLEEVIVLVQFVF